MWWIRFQRRSFDFAGNYGGLLEERVRGVIRYRRSPIPKNGLEIPTTMVESKASLAVFNKMKEIILECNRESEI